MRTEPRVFDLLHFLVGSRDRIVTKAELLETVWGGRIVTESALTRTMSAARKALRDKDRRWIRTVHGKGYRFVGAVDATCDVDGPLAAGRPVDPSRPLVAVLPFTNRGADPDDDYFCEGISEEIASALARVRRVRVVARASSLLAREQKLGPSALRSRLGASFVLEGSVLRKVGLVRVLARLSSTVDREIVWSGRYEAGPAELFAMQDEMCDRVTEALRKHLPAESRAPELVDRSSEDSEKRPEVARRCASQQAYDLYLRAMKQYWALEDDGFSRSIDLLEGSIDIEPTFAPAHVGLSLACTQMCVRGLAGAADVLSRAEPAAERAIELDPLLAEAHSALGFARAYVGRDLPGSGRAHRRALELDPESAAARSRYSETYLWPMGETTEALREKRIAHDLDPLSLLMNTTLGIALYFDRRYDEAIRQLELAVEMFPDQHDARRMLAMVYSSNGQPREALRVRMDVPQLLGRPDTAAALARVFAREGEPGVLREYIANSEPKARRPCQVDSGNRAWRLALHYGHLGDKDGALRWLEEAERRPSGYVVFAAVHPWLDCLHGEPGFNALLNRLGALA